MSSILPQILDDLAQMSARRDDLNLQVAHWVNECQRLELDLEEIEHEDLM